MTAQTLPLTCSITTDSNFNQSQRLLQASFGNGFEQVAKDGLNSTIDKWDIVYSPLEGADLTTLNTFLDTVGCDVWFTWTPLGEAVSKKWRIEKDSLKRKPFSTTKWQISFTIKQVFDLG